MKKLTPRLIVDHPIAMVDSMITISVSDLHPNQKVTVAGLIEEGKIQCISHAHFIADELGQVNLRTDSSLSGTYTGIDSMGIIWSMAYCTKGTRLIKRNASLPYKLHLFVMEGFQRIHDKGCINNVLCESTVERWYLASDTKRIPIRHGNIRGTLFTPRQTDGQTRRPGIIDMFGLMGGLMEYRAALLASYGYSVLALTYFRHDDLPQTLELDYSYFEEAAEFLLNHSSVDKSQGLAVIGMSKGAEIALHMASYDASIRACVAINSSSFYMYGNNTYKGRDLQAFAATLTHLTDR